MKTLKLDHELARQVLAGSKTSTWRMFDDKDLSVGDVVRIIDKVNSERPETWQMIGTAKINRVIEKRLRDITPEDSEGHKVYDSLDDMVTTFQKYYGLGVSDTTVVKIVHFDFIPGQQNSDVQKTTTRLQIVELYSDGGSRGNPGPSACGFVLVDPATRSVLVDKGVYLGVTTNAQAEYLAVKHGLEEARLLGAREVRAYLDSLMVVNQMNGTFKVSNRDLWPIHESIKELLGAFDKVSFSHIPREQNALADAAANRALDEQLGGKTAAADENLS